MKFEDIQSQLQENQAPDEISTELNHESIMSQIIRLQRKTIFAGLAVSVSFAIVFVAIGLLWQKTAPHTWFFQAGMIMIYLDMILALVFIWSLVISWRNHSLNLNSAQFISQTIKKLKRRRFVNRTVIPIYLLILVLGINLVYLESLQEMEEFERLLTHLLVSVCTFGGGMIGVVFGRKRDARIVSPLLAEREEVRAGMGPEGMTTE